MWLLNLESGVFGGLITPFHSVKLSESACLSGQGCGLCIALIRPNHWAASVAQWLEHLSSKQGVVGSNPTRAALLFGLVAFPFFLFIEKSFHVITQLGMCGIFGGLITPVHSLKLSQSPPVYQVRIAAAFV